MSLEKRPEQLGEELLQAAENGDRHKLERCLDEGANINYQYFNRGTALHSAALNRNTDIVQLLIDGGINLNVQNKAGGTALHSAALNKNTEIVHLLIDAGINLNLQNKSGFTALHGAATGGDTEIVHLLIDNGIDLNMQNNNGNTALHFAVWNGKTKIVNLLIDSGINFNLQNTKGRSALHYAVENDYSHIAKVLIEYGCDKNLQDKDGNTTLHKAASNYNKEMVKYLLKKDGDPFILNINGETPKEVTIDDEIIKLLKDYERTLLPGLPTEVKKFDKKSATVFSSLLEEESYPHFESRVMLVGEQGKGKTTIARYLVGKRPSRFRIATNGIELYNGLSYMDRQTKDWLGGKQDFSLEELTVSRSLSQKDKRKKNVMSKIKTPTSECITDMAIDVSLSAVEEKLKHTSNEPSSFDATLQYDFGGLSSTKTFITENVKTMSDHQLKTVPVFPGICGTDMQGIIRGSGRQSGRLVDDYQSSDCPSNRNEPVMQDHPLVKENTDSSNNREIIEALRDNALDDKCSKSRLNGDMHIQTVTRPGVIRKLKNIFGVTKTVKEVKVSITKEKFLKKSIYAGKRQLHNKMIAPIIIWDFGGHDVFYSTHQTFLTYRAIYIIVLDGSRTLDDPCQHEQYIPGKSGHKTAKDYLRFWINAIVTYCKGSIPGYPKIMIVLTHKDQVKPNEDECEAGCPVTNEDFLKVTPSDIHLRRMSLMYSRNNVRELAIRLGLSTTDVDNMLDTDDPRKWNFEVLRQCRNSVAMTFNHIKEAIEASGQDSIHRLCKLVKGGSIDFELQQEKWDLIPTEEHIDRLAPLVGNNSLPFLIELGMEFQTWEQISYKQNERDLVRLNKDILEEWRNKFCPIHSLKPTLRTIAQAFSYIGKSVKIVENTLSDLFDY